MEEGLIKIIHTQNKIFIIHLYVCSYHCKLFICVLHVIVLYCMYLILFCALAISCFCFVSDFIINYIHKYHINKQNALHELFVINNKFSHTYYILYIFRLCIIGTIMTILTMDTFSQGISFDNKLTIFHIVQTSLFTS